MTNPQPSAEHIEKVQKQMRAVGVTWFGMKKLESRYLPRIIHDNETIGGIIYGHRKGNTAMLIATNSRVIFLDRKPGFTNSEEITYDVVAGVTYNKQGSFANVILHTRLGDFGMKFVNIRSAETFINYIEERRLEYENGMNKTSKVVSTDPQHNTVLSNEVLAFLKEHEVGVLSSVDKDAHVHGAVIYHTVGDDGNIYFTTKSETKKARDIRTVGDVAYTVFDESTLQTVQIHGIATIENDQSTREQVFTRIVRSRMSLSAEKLPPVTKIKEGAFIVVRITPSWSDFRDYGKTE